MTSTENTATTPRDNGLTVIEKRADDAATIDDLASLIDGIAVMNGYLLAMLRAATQRVVYPSENAVLADVDKLLAHDVVSRPGCTDHRLNALLAAHELLSGTGRTLLVIAEQLRGLAPGEETAAAAQRAALPSWCGGCGLDSATIAGTETPAASLNPRFRLVDSQPCRTCHPAHFRQDQESERSAS